MYSIIIPVYNNQDSLSLLIDELREVQARIAAKLELVFVVDGSPDSSHELLSSLLPESGLRSQLLLLNRNVGSFNAIFAGLEVTTGSVISVISADLQEPPQLVVDFYERLLTGECDIAIGTRTERADPPFDRLLATTFWAVCRRLVSKDIPPGGFDVFGFSTRVREALLRSRETHAPLPLLLLHLGFRPCFVPYVRRRRPFGRSSWSFRKKLAYVLDAIFAFSNVPGRALLLIGGITISVSVLCLLTTGLIWLLSGSQPAAHSSTLLVVILFGGFNILGFGIVAEYVWRTYQCASPRPSHVVSSHKTWAGR